MTTPLNTETPRSRQLAHTGRSLLGDPDTARRLPTLGARGARPQIIGESKTLRNRLTIIGAPGTLRFSVAPPDESVDAPHCRQEIETDLLGAHLLSYGTARLDQY